MRAFDDEGRLAYTNHRGITINFNTIWKGAR